MKKRELSFGVEVEMTGITRKEAAVLIKKYFNNKYDIEEMYFKENIDGHADEYRIYDNDGYDWIIMDDTTIKPEKKNNYSKNLKDYRVEFISPILNFNDEKSISIFCDIVSLLKKNGAIVNHTCGLHVHIDAKKIKANHLKKLANTVNVIQYSLYKVLDVLNSRLLHVTKLSQNFIDELNSYDKISLPIIKKSLEKMAKEHGKDQQFVYKPEKYYGVNMYNVFSKGTVEFRMFNSTLNINKIMSYIDFCQSISSYSINKSKENTFGVVYSLDSALRLFSLCDSKDLHRYSGAIKPYLEGFGMSHESINDFCSIETHKNKVKASSFEF